MSEKPDVDPHLGDAPSDLEVTDRIRVRLAAPGELATALDAHLRWVADQVLATGIELSDGPLPVVAKVGGAEVSFDLEPDGGR